MVVAHGKSRSTHEGQFRGARHGKVLYTFFGATARPPLLIFRCLLWRRHSIHDPEDRRRPVYRESIDHVVQPGPSCTTTHCAQSAGPID